MKELSPEIRQWIAKEAQDIIAGFVDPLECQERYNHGFEIGYETGASKYALLLQEAEEMMGRMANLLNQAIIPVYQISTKESEALLRSIKNQLIEYYHR